MSRKQDEAKELCRSPAEGKQATRILKWKFDLIRTAILKALSEGDCTFKQLPSRVLEQLDATDAKRLGSLNWYVTTVKLELEVRGEILRVPGSKPQQLKLAGEQCQQQ